MKKYILTIFCGFSIFLAGCQPGTRVIFPGKTKNIVIKDTSLSSQILSCVAEKEAIVTRGDNARKYIEKHLLWSVVAQRYAIEVSQLLENNNYNLPASL